MQDRSIKTLMFHANDPDKHTVCWGPVAQAWMLENKDGLTQGGDLGEGLYSDFAEALCDLTDCLNQPVSLDTLTVTDNPYGD